MDDTCYVTLDTMILHQVDGVPIRLIKQVPMTYTEKTFGDILSYVISNQSDGLNSPYSNEEQDAARKVAKLIEKGRKDASSIDIFYKESGGSNEISIGLDEAVRDHVQRAIYTTEFAIPGGEQKIVPTMDLGISHGIVGGYLHNDYR